MVIWVYCCHFQGLRVPQSDLKAPLFLLLVFLCQFLARGAERLMLSDNKQPKQWSLLAKTTPVGAIWPKFSKEKLTKERGGALDHFVALLSPENDN